MSDGRVLHIAERRIAEPGRTAYVAALATRRAACVARGGQFWAFEHADERGRFVEFTEARDRGALTACLGPADDAGAIWCAVELA